MDEIRFEMTSCWLVEGPFPNSWINQPDSFLFFLLLILGINIIRDMQGFWIAKLDFPDFFAWKDHHIPFQTLGMTPPNDPKWTIYPLVFNIAMENHNF